MINTKALLEPMGSWAWWRSWIQLFVGCAIMGSGFVLFINNSNHYCYRYNTRYLRFCQSLFIIFSKHFYHSDSSNILR